MERINMAVSGEMYLGDSESNSFFNNKITPWIKKKELGLLKFEILFVFVMSLMMCMCFKFVIGAYDKF